jgi:hypothetical protein
MVKMFLTNNLQRFNKVWMEAWEESVPHKIRNLQE